MGRTSIPCDEETRELLAEGKQHTETWDEYLTRLEGQIPANDGDAELGAVLEKLDTLESKLDDLEPDSGGSDVSVNEIRESVRIEVRNQIKELLH